MSTGTRKAQRKREIDAVRKEGVAAYRAKKSVLDNPHRNNSNESHWRAGWYEAKEIDTEPELTIEERVEALEAQVARLQRMLVDSVL